MDQASFTPTEDAQRLVESLHPVDETGVSERVAKLWSRSIKNASQAEALDLVISMTDLTTLEGADSPGKIRNLCQKAVFPDYTDLTCPTVAAVCVYPDCVQQAVVDLRQLGPRAANVEVASVVGGFPSGRTTPLARREELALALTAGADEVDMVIDRGAFLSGNYARVTEEVASVTQFCHQQSPSVKVKAILETGELGSLTAVRKASWLAMYGGAHFIKTSTGKIPLASTPQSVLVMLEAARDYYELTGRRVGVKAAGGIRQAKDAVRYLVLVAETAGPDWLTPEFFRFGASSLLNDVLMQRAHLTTGIYPGPDYFSVS